MSESNGSGHWRRTVEHTFSTGTKATLRRAPNTYAMAGASGLFDEVRAAAAAEEERKARREAGEEVEEPERGFGAVFTEYVIAVCQAYFLHPRILGFGEERQPAEDEESAITFEDLEDSEIEEVMALYRKAKGDAERFRGDGDGARGRANGKGVDDKSKPAPRPGSRKRASAAS